MAIIRIYFLAVHLRTKPYLPSHYPSLAQLQSLYRSLCGTPFDRLTPSSACV